MVLRIKPRTQAFYQLNYTSISLESKFLTDKEAGSRHVETGMGQPRKGDSDFPREKLAGWAETDSTQGLLGLSEGQMFSRHGPKEAG